MIAMPLRFKKQVTPQGIATRKIKLLNLTVSGLVPHYDHVPTHAPRMRSISFIGFSGDLLSRQATC